MIQRNIFRLTGLTLCAAILLTACRKRGDISLPDNYIIFESTEQGIDASENSIAVNLKLSRNTDKDIPVTVNLNPQDLTYGTDFTTTPAANGGTLNLVVPSGNNEVSFTINKVPGALFDGDEKISFEINRSESPVLIGADKKYTLKFGELISSSSSFTVNGGGATYPNKVFIDLSANRQVPVLRTTWDLGFLSDAGDFKVILNSSVGMMAKQVAKNDLTQVTAADTTGFWLEAAYSPFDPQPTQLPYIDYPNGDLSRTAIGTISANAADNKVFIINRGTGVGVPAPERGWKKIRILRNANGGYTLQQADIASSTFTSIEVPKNPAYFFNYVSFESGLVTVEPEKTKWDLAWTYSGYITNFGTGDVPYLFQDIVFQNRNVRVAKVLTNTKSYAAFTAADTASVTFSNAQNAIASDWRVTTSGASVRTDRFYIVQDGNNNYYKLKFTAITDAGIRGFPAIEYALISKG